MVLRRVLRFLNPYFLALALLTAVAIMQMLHPLLLDHSRQLRDIEQDYQRALFASESQLVALMREVTVSPTLQQNIQWGLQHSIAKNLEAHLRAHELDELILFNGNCEVLGHVNLVDRVSGMPPCPFTNDAKNLNERLVWSGLDGTAALAIALPLSFSGAQPFKIVGRTFIDANWLKDAGTLADRARDFDLKIESLPAEAPLLKSGDIISRYLPGIKYYALQESSAKNALFDTWPIACILAAFLLIVYAWWQARADQSLAQHEKLEFLAWLRKNLPFKNPRVPALSLAEGNLNARSEAHSEKENEKAFAIAQELIQKNRDVYLLQQKRFQEEITNLRTEIGDQAVKSQKHAADATHLAMVESLALQLQTGAQKLAKKVTDLQSMSEDIADVLVHGLQTSAQTLSTMTQEWQKQIQARGNAWRFLRSLSEQQGPGGTNMLEQQFAMVLDLCEQISAQAVNSAILQQKFSTQVVQLGKLTNYWRDLSNQSDEHEICHSLLDVVLTAQDAVKQNDRYAAVTFANFLTFGSQESLPKISRSRWLAALQHVYFAFLEALPANGPDRKAISVEISTRFKEEDARYYLIVVLEANTSHTTSEKLTLSDRHLQLLERLLSPYGIRTVEAKNISGAINSVGIVWERAVGKQASGAKAVAKFFRQAPGIDPVAQA